MRIGELAARTGVSVRSLRYYEQQGLLSSSRTPGGQRQFEEGDVERVRFVQRLYAANLSSRTINAVMPCAEDPSTRNSDAALERMARERARITAQIDDLLRARDTLDAMVVVAQAHRATLLGGPRVPEARTDAAHGPVTETESAPGRAA
jgi:DNA-binding transcriptional MerR regulator